MSNTLIFAIMVLMVLVWLCLGLYWGYHYALHHHKIVEVESVSKYINDNFPTEWDAYQLGFKEGYEIGSKDGREPPL